MDVVDGVIVVYKWRIVSSVGLRKLCTGDHVEGRAKMRLGSM